MTGTAVARHRASPLAGHHSFRNAPTTRRVTKHQRLLKRVNMALLRCCQEGFLHLFDKDYHGWPGSTGSWGQKQIGNGYAQLEFGGSPLDTTSRATGTGQRTYVVSWPGVAGRGRRCRATPHIRSIRRLGGGAGEFVYSPSRCEGLVCKRASCAAAKRPAGRRTGVPRSA